MARTIGYSATETTITVRVKGLDTSYTFSDRQIIWLLYDTNEDLVLRITKTVSANASSTDYVTFKDLTPNSKYIVKYELLYSSTTSGALDSFVTDYKTIWTDESEVAIEHFKWDTAKTSSNSFNVTASEWNRLIDKVIEVYKYKGGYDSVKYPMTKVTKGDVFYAKRFNEVRYAIGSLYSTGLSDKTSGDKIKASELNQLVTSLNSAIDNL